MSSTFQTIFSDFSSVIGQSTANAVPVDSGDLHLGLSDIQDLFTNYYADSVSFPATLPAGFSTIQTDISTAVSGLTANSVSLAVILGVTQDRGSLEYVQFSLTLPETYSFEIPNTSEQVSVSNPSLSIFIYNPSFGGGYAQAVSSLALSIGTQFLGVTSQIRLTLPDFGVYVSSSTSLSLIDSFLQTFGCSNTSLSNILNSSTGAFDAVVFLKETRFDLMLTIDTGSSCSWYGFDLENVSIDLSYFSELTFSIGAQIEISDGNNSLRIDVTLTDDGSGGLDVSGEGAFSPALDVNGVANYLAGVIGGSIPDFPFELDIVSMALSMSESGGKLATVDGGCAADLVLQDSGSSVQFDVRLSYSAGGNVAVSVQLGDIELTGTTGSGLSVFSATASDNSVISVRSLAQFFNLQALENIPAFQSISVGGMFLAADSSTSPSPHLVGLQLNIANGTIQQELLKFITGNSQIGLSSITVFAASRQWPSAALSSLSSVLAGSDWHPSFPPEILRGPGLVADVAFGGQTYTLPVLPSGQGAPGGSSSNDFSAAALSNPALGSQSAPVQPAPVREQNAIRWFDVQEQLGPLYVNRVGFQLQQQSGTSSLTLTSDASVTLGPFRATLQDFSFTGPLTWNISIADLSVGLQGLSLAYSKPPLVINGGLLHKKKAGEDIYVGSVLIETSSFLLSAVAEYAEVTVADDSFKSLALFAVLNNPPLGGPVFCFVTGLAAGFGYNSSLNIPTTAGQVGNFALLTAAGPIPGGGQAPDISTLTSCISPSAGEDWIAAGILFRSFEFIDSTVLLTAAFGNNLQFAILGQSEMSLPPASNEGLAYAQVDIEAAYTPSTGNLAVYGILTNNSYILSRDCHLTGGFAYVLENDGSFVLTFGGYAPSYDYQQFSYPSIPRVQFLWQVDSHTQIKGDQYFAVTPAVMMAGGGLEATWNCGIFSAWFNLNVDLFMQWRPFAYSGGFSMQIGVSFDLHIWFVNVSFSFQLGASIQIEGPPFHGTAHIDLDVVSITVNFGPPAQTPAALVWSQFRELLPAKGSVVSWNKATNTVTESGSPLVAARISQGLLLDLSQSRASANDPDWIINGTDFCIHFQSSIPVTVLAADGSIGTATLPGGAGTSMGILPMGIQSATGTLQINITDSSNNIVPVSGNPIFNIVFTQTQMATAHWGQDSPQGVNTPAMNMNSGCRISALRGTLVETVLIPLSALQQTPQVTAYSDRPASQNPF